MNTFGQLFRVTTFGESHGISLGAVIDGCPAGLTLSEELVQIELDRRRPGQSRLVTPRNEADRVHIVSGVFEGRTTGTPVTLIVHNGDVDSSKYEPFRDVYRPSHADYTWEAKFGHRDWRGGGRASARETVARVAAGAVAALLLRQWADVEIIAWVSDVADITSEVDPGTVTREAVETNDVRCPDAVAATLMEARIRDVRRTKDSVGGCIRCVVRNLPVGLGEPVFGKLDAMLAMAMLSLPACKAFELGSGFRGTRQLGSEHNDSFVMREHQVRTSTNRSGGVQGGITNGENIEFRCGFKPVATIFQPQTTVNAHGDGVVLEARGRHDPCVLPRAVPIVEAMAALVLVDAWLLQAAHRAGSLVGRAAVSE